MHEASAALAILNLALEEANNSGAIKINTIRIISGASRGIMEDSLRFYFGVCARGTIAENAQMVVTTRKVELHCNHCNLDFERQRFSFNCPSCGNPGVFTSKGSEFYIEDIEVEKCN